MKKHEHCVDYKPCLDNVREDCLNCKNYEIISFAEYKFKCKFNKENKNE